MHELSITTNILNIAIKHAQKAGASRVTDIYIVLGQFSSIIDDSVQYYWDIINVGNICDSARLHFDRIPARFLCKNCDLVHNLARQLSPCPFCGSADITLICGEEIFVDKIEVEYEDAQ